MPELIEHGQKIQYKRRGQWHDGVIHGQRTYSNEEGDVQRMTYLIDTGNTVREDIGANAKGKPEKVRQPEQIEVDQSFVKLA